MAIINDDDQSNTVFGTTGDDVINGNGGNDNLVGARGADVLNGGSDFDTADYSSSVAVGDTGAFIGVNVFLENTGVGVGIGGDAEGDTYNSIEGVIGTAFADTLGGNDTGNQLNGGDGGDVLKGFGGADSLKGDSGDDTLSGGEGNDILNGGEDADALIGGGGIDTADYRDSFADDGIDVNLANGTGSGGDAQGNTFEAIENVFGSFLADSITGDTAANLLRGDVGNDTLIGGEGADILEGESGADVMIGGQGNDTFVFEGQDTIFEVGSAGTDTIRTSADFNLSNTTVIIGNVENLTLTGTQDTQGFGNTLNNVLTGNSGDNRLVGGLGADTMRGAAGDDEYFVDSPSDVVDESVAGSGGKDEVNASISFSLSGSKALGNIENLDLSGSANINGAGNALSNTIDGNVGRNDLMGLGGNDVLTGFGGADTFVFSAALTPNNVDTITDFRVVDDTMRLENAFMTGLSTGQLSAAAFHIGATASDASDRIIYNSANGQLRYDADGSGAGASVRFADLDTGLLLTCTDLLIV